MQLNIRFTRNKLCSSKRSHTIRRVIHNGMHLHYYLERLHTRRSQYHVCKGRGKHSVFFSHRTSVWKNAQLTRSASGVSLSTTKAGQPAHPLSSFTIANRWTRDLFGTKDERAQNETNLRFNCFSIRHIRLRVRGFNFLGVGSCILS